MFQPVCIINPCVTWVDPRQNQNLNICDPGHPLLTRVGYSQYGSTQSDKFVVCSTHR